MKHYNFFYLEVLLRETNNLINRLNFDYQVELSPWRNRQVAIHEVNKLDNSVDVVFDNLTFEEAFHWLLGYNTALLNLMNENLSI